MTCLQCAAMVADANRLVTKAGTHLDSISYSIAVDERAGHPEDGDKLARQKELQDWHTKMVRDWRLITDMRNRHHGTDELEHCANPFCHRLITFEDQRKGRTGCDACGEPMTPAEMVLHVANTMELTITAREIQASNERELAAATKRKRSRKLSR